MVTDYAKLQGTNVNGEMVCWWWLRSPGGMANFASIVSPDMTGILPIKKYGQHSALNMFDEYSNITLMQLVEYTGFTEDEVKDKCDEYGCDYNRIQEWYNGYDVTGIIAPDPNYEIQKATGKELKYDKTLETAADQIRSKNYLQKLTHYKGHTLLICINYEKDAGSADIAYKHHCCSIERV